MLEPTAHDLIVDQSPAIVERGARLTTWYAQGHTDGLGDRLLMFDNTSAPSWEILRFTPGLASDERFDTALRHRIERLRSFHHPAFPLVRSIDELGHEHGLAVVSTHVAGVRLSDALRKPRSEQFAVQLIRQLMPALTALHEHAPGLAHGALTLDRVVLTADRRLMIREHMVGAAIQSLEWPAAKLWAGFGILAPSSGAASPSLDARSDVTQLALVALSLVAGRRIGPEEYPHSARALLDRIVRLDSLRHWLERALQLDDRAFATAREANDALADLQNDHWRAEEGVETASRLAARPLPRPDAGPPSGPRAVDRQPPLEQTGLVPLSPAPRPARAIRWAAIAAGLVAIAEAAFIGRLFYLESGRQLTVTAATVVESPQPPADSTVNQPLLLAPLQMRIAPGAPPIEVLPAVAGADLGIKRLDVGAAKDRVGVPAAVPPRSGGFRVSSPIELYVLDGERVLGSSGDGPIVTSAGRHQFEFLNSVIGYRVRREVDVRPGHITALSIAVPNGTLNINATPWAAVWIDGVSYGETPLGDLSIVPGEHDIVFRHPQLGERRERVIVRPDTAGRVAVNLKEEAVPGSGKAGEQRSP